MGRKAGDGNMASYVDYLNKYDRKARGAGSDKKPPTDRFSALDIRRAHSAAQDFGVNKYDAAEQVLQYARRNEDNTKMGGGSKAQLDKLRDLLSKRPSSDEDKKPEPTPMPPIKEEPRRDQGGGRQVIGDITGGDDSLISPIYQDNDIGIDGDNNMVNQNNSINQEVDRRDQSDNRRYYGGSDRIFNYGDIEDTGSELRSQFLDNFIDKNIADFTNSGIRDMRVFGS